MALRKSHSFIALISMLLMLGVSTAFAADQAPAPAKAGVVNINTADAGQLSLLPRIGPKAAQRIVDYRKANGPFKTTTDLMQVKGIGDKTFQLLSPYLTTDGDTTLTAKQHGPRKAKSSPSTKAQQ
ncbi:MAG: helix-hairpin-helix domain-containing protein [Thermoanaerobaculia bacterium]